jgi:hypothetical protein
MRFKKSAAAMLISTAVVVGSGGAAFAGERSGTGDETQGPSHAASLCVFSGLEDFDFEAPVDPGVTQNWGQIVKTVPGHLGGANSVITPFGEEGCNAHMYPNPEKQ